MALINIIRLWRTQHAQANAIVISEGKMCLHCQNGTMNAVTHALTTVPFEETFQRGRFHRGVLVHECSAYPDTRNQLRTCMVTSALMLSPNMRPIEHPYLR